MINGFMAEAFICFFKYLRIRELMLSDIVKARSYKMDVVLIASTVTTRLVMIDHELSGP